MKNHAKALRITVTCNLKLQYNEYRLYDDMKTLMKDYKKKLKYLKITNKNNVYYRELTIIEDIDVNQLKFFANQHLHHVVVSDMRK